MRMVVVAEIIIPFGLFIAQHGARRCTLAMISALAMTNVSLVDVLFFSEIQFLHVYTLGVHHGLEVGGEVDLVRQGGVDQEYPSPKPPPDPVVQLLVVIDIIQRKIQCIQCGGAEVVYTPNAYSQCPSSSNLQYFLA